MKDSQERTRVYGEQVVLDGGAVREFFRLRADRASGPEPLTSVLYHDHDPELARSRSEYEKSALLPFLQMDGTQSVLDVGCGIGRWAGILADSCTSYVGVDFSTELLEYACAANPAEHMDFVECAAQDVSAERVGSDFDRILLIGVLIYLNDDQVTAALRGLASCAATHSVIVVREPVGVARRLTLRGHWSQELRAKYSAVYRTSGELLEVMKETLGDQGFCLRHKQRLLPSELSDRTDTAQWFYVWSR